MSSQISVEVILLVIIVCGTYYMTHRNFIVIPREEPALMLGNPYMGEAKGDDRYTMAPRPVRQWQPGLSGIPQIASRGPPESYQQMGVIDGGDGKILPLYGRRVSPRSDYFNYYTRTDTYNPVAIPLNFKKRNCQDSVGCHEVMNGDELDITATGQKGKVTLYGFETPLRI